jgi:tetratricopeptide (TPR) repeat protein
MVLLGMVLGELRDPQSVELEREALGIRRRLYGDRHRLVADSLSESAFTMWNAAEPPQWELAEQYYKDAISIYEETLGPAHQDLARSLQAFGLMRSRQGRQDEAEQLLRRALEMNRSVLGEEHQFTVECMLSLADVLKSTGRLDDAESYLQHVLERTPRLFGRASVPRMLRTIASLHVAKRDFTAAEKTLRESVGLLCGLIREHHPQRAAELDRCIEAMKSDASDEAYRGAVHAALDCGADALNVLASLLARARLRDAEGDLAAAIAILDDAIAVADAHPVVGMRFRPTLLDLRQKALSNPPADSQ